MEKITENVNNLAKELVSTADVASYIQVVNPTTGKVNNIKISDLASVVAAEVGSVLAANPKLISQEVSIRQGETITLPFYAGICVMKSVSTNAACAFSKQTAAKDAKMDFIWNGGEPYYKLNDETAALINILKGDSGAVCLKNNSSYDTKVSLCYLGF